MSKMKYEKCSLYRQIISILLVVVLSLALVVGNLHQVLKKHQRLVPGIDGQSRLRREVHYGSQIGNLRGRPGEGYYITVEIGTPPQQLNLLIDTGSSNLAVACGASKDISSYFHTHKSSTYKESGRSVNVSYTQGSWSGRLVEDYITISTFPDSTVRANIACITESKNFFINTSDWQGIMGLGYADIARPDGSIEPLFDSIVRDGHSNDIFSIQLCGLGYISSNTDNTVGGSLGWLSSGKKGISSLLWEETWEKMEETPFFPEEMEETRKKLGIKVFGGTAPSLYTGEILSTPIDKEWYYEVIIVDIEVAGESLGMDCKEYNFGKTIVDTGTTNLRLPIRVFNKLQVHMQKAMQEGADIAMLKDGFWSGDDVLCWHTGHIPYNSFPTISLSLPLNSTESFKLVISPQQYLRPADEDNDNVPDHDCFKLGISSLESGSVIGAIVMEGFYVVFDRANKQVMFANSTCGVVDSGAVKSHVQGYNKYSGGYKDCAYKKVFSQSNTLTIVGYVLAGICGICIIPILVLVVQWQCHRFRCRRRERSNSDINDLMDGSS